MCRMRCCVLSVLCMGLCASTLAGDAPKLADLLPGVWRGVHSSGGIGLQLHVRVQKSGAGFAGQGLMWGGFTEEQAQAAARGQKPVGGGVCALEPFAVKLDGETVTFQGLSIQALAGAGKRNPDVLTGKLIAPGMFAGDAAEAKKGGLFGLCKEEALATPPLDLEKGKTHKLAWLGGENYHYTCYIPKSYDPQKPTPVLINFSPGGDGQPLSTKMAEETGWIMAGLTEAKNGPQVEERRVARRPAAPPEH